METGKLNARTTIEVKMHLHKSNCQTFTSVNALWVQRGPGWKFWIMLLVNSNNFSPSDQVSGVIMCCWFQRYFVMKVDGCGWKGCSLPRCQVPLFHPNSISHSAHVDEAYCWLLILVSIAQRITAISSHSPHIPLRLATSALIQASATRKWTAVLSLLK